MRLWIILSVLYCAAVAQACPVDFYDHGVGRVKKRHGRPPCATRQDVLPREGETEVPTNARLWWLPALDHPDQPLGFGAHMTYELAGTSFTTGAVEDHDAPVAPRNTEVWIDVEGGDDHTRSPISSIGIHSDLDPDARIVHVTITDKLGSVTYYASADAPGICDLQLAILASPAMVSITAIDLAGNESAPDVVHVRPRIFKGAPMTSQLYADATSPSETRVTKTHADDTLALVILPPVIFIPAFVIILSIAARARRHKREGAPVEPFAIASVDDLARAVRDRALLTLTVVALATALATRGHSFLGATLVASPVMGWVAALSVMRLWASHRALQLIAYTDALAEVRYDHVDVIARGQHAVLRAPPSRVRLAQGRGVPRARL